MSQEKIFSQLISEMAKNGNISSAEYNLLSIKAKELGLSKKALDLMIKMELSDSPIESAHQEEMAPQQLNEERINKPEKFREVFRSAITRFGSILTPDILIVTNDHVTYRKRNKTLINVDSISILLEKISSVEIDTSLLGTDIIIKSYGAGKIVCKKFTLSDAKKVKELIESVKT